MSRLITYFKKIILAAAMPTILLSGCYKATPEKTIAASSDKTHNLEKGKSFARTSVFEPNNMAWQELGIGYNNQNTRYNKAKLYLAQGLTEVAKNPVIAKWIVEEAKIHEDNVFYFDNLFARFPATKAIMESIVDPLGEKTGWSFEQVQREMQYEDFDIKASIYLANTDIADASLKPMVSPGYDIMPEDENHPTDVVLGFFINEQNKVSRINLWDEIVKNVTAPIFAVDGRATNKPPLVINNADMGNYAGPGPVIIQTTPKYRINITQFQIGYRYENTGKSEFAVAGKCLFFPYPGQVVNGSTNSASPNSRKFIRKGCGQSLIDDKEVASVESSIINNWTPVNTDSYFCWMGVEYPNNPAYSEHDSYWISSSTNASGVQQGSVSRKKLYYNTYENDGGFTSLKTLSPASINGVPLGLKGRMGSYNEWYQYDPYDLTSWAPVNTFDGNSIFSYTNWETFRWGPPSKGGWTKLKISGVCQ